MARWAQLRVLQSILHRQAASPNEPIDGKKFHSGNTLQHHMEKLSVLALAELLKQGLQNIVEVSTGTM